MGDATTCNEDALMAAQPGGHSCPEHVVSQVRTALWRWRAGPSEVLSRPDVALTPTAGTGRNDPDVTVTLTLGEAARLASLLCSLPIVYDPRHELHDAADQT